jgi:hypothetical protein
MGDYGEDLLTHLCRIVQVCTRVIPASGAIPNYRPEEIREAKSRDAMWNHTRVTAPVYAVNTHTQGMSVGLRSIIVMLRTALHTCSHIPLVYYHRPQCGQRTAFRVGWVVICPLPHHSLSRSFYYSGGSHR